MIVLYAFEKLRKGTVIFVVSVCVEQLVSHWNDFHKISFLSIFFFEKYVGENLSFIKI
jgi:hypothetical protein